MKRNIIYLRISKTDDYQDTSHQLNSCIEFCKEKGLIINETEDIIKDEGISAYSKSWEKRDGFRKVMELATNGKIDNLVVFESSRISRQFIQGQVLLDELSSYGVKVWDVSSGVLINKSEVDMILNAFKFYMNQQSSSDTSKRIKSQKEFAKKKGLYIGGRQLYGFKVVIGEDGNKYEVVNNEVTHNVINMFECYINEGSLETMRRYNMSSNQVLMQKLKNEKYKIIVGNTLFDKVQELIKDRRCCKNTNARNLNRSKELFESLLYHVCGNKLTIDRNRSGEIYYRCRKCRGDKNIINKKSFCKQLSINIENDVKDILNNLDENKLNEVYNKKNRSSKSIKEVEIKELNKLLTSKNKALKLANAKLQDYIMNDADYNLITNISDMITEVKKEIEDINNKLDDEKEKLNLIKQETKNQSELIENILKAREIYNKANVNQKKSILNMIIDKVIVRDIDDYDIHLNI